MLSLNKIKQIGLLDKKKYRLKYNCFVVEGKKMTLELLKNKNFKILDFFTTNKTLVNKYPNNNFSIINEADLQRISFLKTANTSLALVELPEQKTNENINDIVLALDNIQDPGNLGTIIRTASWFGVKNIVCSQNSADVYNPKVVQSSMGAIFNVNIVYTDLLEYLTKQKNKNTPIYGTHLKGNNIYKTELCLPSIIVMGNESKGISYEICELLSHKILIPRWQNNLPETESLNVGVACAITLSEFRSRFVK